MNLAGLVFFGITAAPERRELIRDLCAWQDIWHTRLVLIERGVDGKAQDLLLQYSVKPNMEGSKGYELRKAQQ